MGPVQLGLGVTVKAITAGAFHTCALLADGTVRCWGFNGEGRLGYANTNAVGDDEQPGAVGAVDLGPGRTATAISAGGAHTCAVLDNGSVRCWGFGSDGRLGYANRDNIGDDETPGSTGAVDLGVGRTAVTISAGLSHTCAILDNGAVSCWGLGANGQLGYGYDIRAVGDDETPASVGAVDLGAGRTAKAISAGGGHTCALLDDAGVRCWGFGGNGRLGYGNTSTFGDDETPGSVPRVDFGPGRTATAISAGGSHSCALLDDAGVRCWGFGSGGRLGYGNTNDVGDDEMPAAAGPVDLGPGRKVVAVSAGDSSTCARLDDGSVRCWGDGTYGRLGYCDTRAIGDDETPGLIGPVELGIPGSPGAGCAAAPPSLVPPPGPTPPAPGPGPPPAPDRTAAALAAQARRSTALLSCLRGVSRSARTQRPRVRRLCLARYGRTPGRVTTLAARAVGPTTIRLTFRAAGTDGAKPPASRTYLIKQSQRPIRTPRDVRRAKSLCQGRCRFSITEVGGKLDLTVTNLRRHATYHYVIIARDNVSTRAGPRSRSISARTA